MRPIFALLIFLFRRDRQFWRGHHLPHADRPRDPFPDRPEAVPVDGRDAQGSAEAQSDPGAFQGRQDSVSSRKSLSSTSRRRSIRPPAACRSCSRSRSFMRSTRCCSCRSKCGTSPCILWIKDLSAPDPLTPVNLFGLLHFAPTRFPGDRRAADPGRRVAVGDDEAQPATDGSGAGPGLRDHAVVPGVHHGAVRGRPSALLAD